MERHTPMWMSHHWPDQYDRCAHIRGRHVCRRCLWFYPACFAVTAASLAGLHWPRPWDWWLVLLLPIPVVAEWWAEHRGLARYHPTRQVALSLIAAPAVGRGLARYLRHPGDPLFWTAVIGYAVVCLIPMLWPRRVTTPTPPVPVPTGSTAAGDSARSEP